MTAREHVRSPWRTAYELLLTSRSGTSEAVTLKVNAKGDVQPEVTAVRQDGESLLEAYGRASHVLRVARADFSANGAAATAELPEGMTEEIPF